MTNLFKKFSNNLIDNYEGKSFLTFCIKMIAFKIYHNDYTLIWYKEMLY